MKRFLVFALAAVMPFANPIIGGNNALIRDEMTSEGFVSGSTGWRIARNGDAEFNTATIRGKIIGGTDPGAHIEINGSDAPNGIAFYTGDADETFPGVIQPESDSSVLAVRFESPQRTGALNGNSIFELGTDKTAVTNSYAQVDTPGQFTVNANHWDLNGTGTTLVSDTDGTGDYLDANAPRIFLRDITSGNSNGAVVEGGDVLRIGETWNNIPLVNSWADVAGARANYFKDATGRVQLRGQIVSGTSTTIATLPAGYRPTQTMEWIMRGVGGVIMCAVSVATTGVMTVTANASTAQGSGIKLDAISFPTF